MPPHRSGWPTALAYLVLTACGATSAGAPPAESSAIAVATPEPGPANDPAPGKSTPLRSESDAGSSTASEGARSVIAKDGAEAIRSAALKWQASNPDQCPTLEGLIREELLIAGMDEDAWDRRYTLSCGGDGGVTVTSFGPDGEPGTSDDVIAGP